MPPDLMAYWLTHSSAFRYAERQAWRTGYRWRAQRITWTGAPDVLGRRPQWHVQQTPIPLEVAEPCS
jgi:hypothetical protein